MNNSAKKAFEETFIQEPSSEFNARLMSRIETKTQKQIQPKESHSVLYVFLFFILGLPLIAVVGMSISQSDLTDVTLTQQSLDFSYLSGFLSKIWAEWQVMLVFLFAFFGLQMLGRHGNGIRGEKRMVHTDF